MNYDSRYEVRNPKIEAKLKELGHAIDRDLPPGCGFTLMIYEFGEGGNMFYFSNAKRQDMIAAMREFIAKHAEN